MTTPRLLSERYELGETLGYGGMSEVYLGRDTRLGRDVAVKVLRADLARDPQFQHRFRREAQNAAALNHPAIVAVWDTGEVSSEFGPLPYIVMEYVEGQTLREIVKTEGPMSQAHVVDVMADVCAALDFSHRHGIIHRDVKPANIMINQRGEVKVMDFGIARALGDGQNVTQTAAVIGTAQYLSPEQARGEAVDARSDVYAAGCVLFELLTGEPPFTGDTPVAVAYQHVREDPRRPSEVNPDLPPELDAVVLKALSKNPQNRYQSAAEMRADLVRVRSGQRPVAPLVMSDEERTVLLDSTGPTRRIASGSRNTPADPDWDEDDAGRGTGRKVAIGVGIAVVLGLIAFVAFQFIGGPTQPAQVAVPPGLVGQQQESARQAVLAAELQPDIRDAESQPDQVGKVVQTDPPGGTQVAEGSRVTLFIGKGPGQVTIPQLKGRSVADADQVLRNAGLTLGQRTDEPTTDPNLVDRVVTTTPGPGETVAGGTAVAYTVGVKQQTTQVPNVSGQDQNSAQAALQAAQLQVKVAQVSGPGPAGSVVGTEPKAGSTVPIGSTVTLQVSRGDESEVPNVVGQAPQAAQVILAQAGFRNVTLVPTSSSDPSDLNKVVKQSPAAGNSAGQDEQITLTWVPFPGTGGN